MPRQFKYFVSGSAPTLYPADTFYALLYYAPDKVLEIPKRYPYQGAWGEQLSTNMLENECFSLPCWIDIVWLSVVEQKFYSLTARLPERQLEALFQLKELDENGNESASSLFEYITIGMAPCGGLAVWAYGTKKSVLMTWAKAEETNVEMADFVPSNPSITLDSYCKLYINNDERVRKNLLSNGLPSRSLYDKYMQQFLYRYYLLFEQWNNTKGEWQKYGEYDPIPDEYFLEEELYDGTHDTLHDGSLMTYHQAGKPKRLVVKWYVKKLEYTAYFWFEDEAIRNIFDRFYGAHPDTKTDFMIRIDSEKNKYELALYRYGLKEPQVISESAYQLLVFKNKFEYYRSANYNQPRGAWIW